MNKITDFSALFRRASFALAAFLLAAMNLSAQASDSLRTYRVVFRDKGPEKFVPDSKIYRKTVALHNVQCIERRKKILPADNIFSLSDAPIFQPYLDSLTKHGSVILLTLRWNNYAVIRCDSLVASTISKFSFVKLLQRTGSKLTLMSAKSSASPWIIQSKDSGISPKILEQSGCGSFRYGPSLNQAAMLGIPELHSMGITGQGALIGFLDSGFRWKVNSATQHANIIATYDFIHNDSIVSNEDNDVASQDDHGSMVLSTVAGFEQDSLIGIAPFASFLLAKTEDIPTETRIEEDNYAAAIEWAESQGVDITSSSLGYLTFNEPDENYTFQDLNGHSTITADIVNKAVARGVICITAAGNNGPLAETIISPADADSVITVGGLMPDGNTPAAFSSRGPNSRGVIKPDIAAQAVSVYGAIHYQENGLRNGSGTSFATPLIAGCAGLIKSVFPEITPHQLREALYSSASQSSAKDDTLGFGRANIPEAMLKIGTIISPGYATYPIDNVQRFCFYIRSPYSTLQPRLAWFPNGSILPHYYPLKATEQQWQFVGDIPKTDFGVDGDGRFYLEVSTSGDRRTMPYFFDNNEKTLSLAFGERNISCGIDEKTLPLNPNIMTNVEVMPNLADASREQVAITIPLDIETSFEVELYNTTGQRVWSNSVHSPHAGITTCQIPVRYLAVGYYFVAVRANGRVMTAVLVRN